MAASRNLKLGIFVLAALVAAVVTAVVLGIHAMAPRTVTYHTYFDESVQGLELGAPVKYRGVRIGSVDDVGIAPDRKHVEVVLALSQRAVERLGLAEAAPALQAHLAVQGLTGLQFVDLDVDGKAAPALPFAPAQPYIPSRKSLVTGITTDMQSLAGRIPELVDHTAATLDRLDRLLDDVHESRLLERATDTLATIDTTVAEVGRHANAALDKLGHDADHGGRVLDRATGVLDRISAVLDQLSELRGLVASARRATDAAGDVARSARTTPDALDRALRELAEAARSVRDLAEQIDRDPDMLVKGRARSDKR